VGGGRELTCARGSNSYSPVEECIYTHCLVAPCPAALADLEAEVKQHYSKYNKGAGKGLTSQDVQAEYQRIKTQVSHHLLGNLLPL
jgi:hypothetical protein